MVQILKALSHTAERYNEAISSERHANSICAKTGQEHTDKNKWSQQTVRRPKGLYRLNGDMKPTHRTERYEDEGKSILSTTADAMFDYRCQGKFRSADS